MCWIRTHVNEILAMAFEWQHYEHTSSWHICSSGMSKHLTALVTHWWWWHICDRTNKHGVTPAGMPEPNRDVKPNTDSFGQSLSGRFSTRRLLYRHLFFLCGIPSCPGLYARLLPMRFSPLSPHARLCRTSTSFFACHTKALIHSSQGKDGTLATALSLQWYMFNKQGRNQRPLSLCAHACVCEGTVVNKRAGINTHIEVS